jgi:hypothetical protein
MFRALFLAAAAAAAALVLAAPAGAATYQVDGKQRVIDEAAGLSKVTGGLVGRWATTSFEVVATEPYVEGNGTEEFSGCIDRRRDRSCKGDPSGTISFEFRYWGLYGSADPASLIWGSCWHPVVGGTGAFAGAAGVVTFVDSPTPNGVKTSYVGTITTKGGKASRRAARTAAAQPGC